MDYVLAVSMQLEKGSACVSHAVFGVSPNTRPGCTLSLIGDTAQAPRSVGETPTDATGTVALPFSDFILTA
jgi:hypothetical protein